MNNKLHHITGEYLNGDSYGTSSRDILEIKNILIDLSETYSDYLFNPENYNKADVVNIETIYLETEDA